MKKLIILLGVYALSGCAVPAQKIANTLSGNPEIVIKCTTQDEVKDHIIAAMSDGGMTLEQEGKNSLFFTISVAKAEGDLASSLKQILLIGNKYSTPPIYEFRYSIYNYKGDVKVTAVASLSSQMAFGKVNRITMSDSGDAFNGIQSGLIKLKEGLENKNCVNKSANKKAPVQSEPIDCMMLESPDDVKACYAKQQ